jgi:hypothetical protein
MGNKMRPYIDSEDEFYTHYDVDISKQQEPVKQPTKKKDYSIITKKVLVIFGIIVIVKIAVLMLWI